MKLRFFTHHQINKSSNLIKDILRGFWLLLKFRYWQIHGVVVSNLENHFSYTYKVLSTFYVSGLLIFFECSLREIHNHIEREQINEQNKLFNKSCSIIGYKLIDLKFLSTT